AGNPGQLEPEPEAVGLPLHGGAVAAVGGDRDLASHAELGHALLVEEKLGLGEQARLAAFLQEVEGGIERELRLREPLRNLERRGDAAAPFEAELPARALEQLEDAGAEAEAVGLLDGYADLGAHAAEHVAREGFGELLVGGGVYIALEQHRITHALHLELLEA